jgi:hypothetical protein
VSRARLLAALVAPLLLVPAIGWVLIEYGPERAVVFAVYPLVWALAFLVAGIICMVLRPPRSAGTILRRAAVWATATMLGATVLLFGASFLFHP